MSDQVSTVVEPFVRRGLFASTEQAVVEMARDYVLRQIEHFQSITEKFQSKYGMSYEQFDAYLKSRAAKLASKASPQLNQAIMTEEDDGLEWKAANEMLQAWLGLRSEVGK